MPLALSPRSILFLTFLPFFLRLSLPFCLPFFLPLFLLPPYRAFSHPIPESITIQLLFLGATTI